MKKITIIKFLFVSVLCIICLEANSKQYINQTSSINESEESILFNIQDKIHNSFVKDFSLKTDSELLKIKIELEEIDKDGENNIVLYWRAYLQFYRSIYYLQTNDKAKSKEAIELAINLMDNMSNKTSEDYALLSRIQGFSLQFPKMGSLSKIRKMTKNGKLALELDGNNIRANFVYATNDYYTPKMYGGGKKAEEFLLKAISLPSQKTPNNYLPSWGKEDAYEMLIKIYINNEQWDLANKYFKQAIELYPNLKSLSTQILDK